MGLFQKTCSTNSQVTSVPNPSKYQILRRYFTTHYLVLEAQYEGCTNFEGRKIMVYKHPSEKVGKSGSLDPHFQPCNDAPVARFTPTESGWFDACEYASLKDKKETTDAKLAKWLHDRLGCQEL